MTKELPNTPRVTSGLTDPGVPTPEEENQLPYSEWGYSVLPSTSAAPSSHSRLEIPSHKGHTRHFCSHEGSAVLVSRQEFLGPARGGSLGLMLLSAANRWQRPGDNFVHSQAALSLQVHWSLLGGVLLLVPALISQHSEPWGQ